jgi:hypothetical protein
MTTGSNPPKIMRFPSKGISAMSDISSANSGDIMRAFAASFVALSGHSIYAKTTVSPGSAFTAIGKDVTSPSGTSSPQHSTEERAPIGLKMRSQASFACEMYASFAPFGTAATNPA